MPADHAKTKEELVAELEAARRRIAELEARRGERKSTEEVIQKNEKRYRQLAKKRQELEFIINRTPAIVFLWKNGEGWPVEFVSENIDQFGYTPDDLYSGRVPYTEIVHPDDLTRVAEEVMEYSNRGVADFTQEYRIITKSGDTRWTDDRTWVRKDEKGNITHYQGILLDITERKQAEEELARHREHLEDLVQERTSSLTLALEQREMEIEIRKRTEEALRESEERYIQLFNSSNDAVGVHSMKGGKLGKFTEVNDLLCTRLGYSREELLRLSPADIDGSGMDEDRRQAVETLLETGKCIFEMVHIGKSGDKISVEISSRMFEIAGERHVLSIARDITERKQAEEELRESEETFRMLVEDAPFGLSIMRPDKTFEYFNREFVALFGYTLKDLPDKQIWFEKAYPDPEYRKHVVSTWTKDLGKSVTVGEVKPRAFLVRCKDGTDKATHFRAVALRDGRQLLSYEDITFRTEVEEKLRHRESLLDGTIEATADGILVVDNEGRIIKVNKRLAEMWRIPDELIERRDDGLFLAFAQEQLKDPEAFLSRIRELYCSAEEDVEIICFKDGRIYERYSCPLMEGRHLSGRVWSFHDITEREQTNIELICEKDKALAANRAKSEFLANMSHELRTPLNGVLGMLQILQESPLDSGQKECLEAALSSGKGLTRIIGDILDISRIESGKMDIHEDEFEIGEVMHSIQGMFMNEASPKNLFINYYIDPNLSSSAIGDSGRLRQILFNLVGNAIKFTEQGEVNVRAYPKEIGTDRFELCFEVLDTGIGIPSDKLTMIYEPFSQVDGSHTRKYGGTGLGLSIVKRLTDLMGGTLYVESELGVGTIFRVCIPVKTLEGEYSVEEQPSTAMTSHEALESISKLHALLAEDDLSNQLVVRRIMEKQGHTVTCVATGRDAIAALEKENFDLILMDVQMPEMDGTEATLEIRKDERFRDLPIIALTAHAMVGDRERFLEVGMNDYLAKPIDMEELKAVLRRMIGKGK